MPQRSVATNYTFEQQRSEINLLAADFWSHKTAVDGAATSYLKHDGSNDFTGGTLAVPAAFTINSNSGAGTVTISGNLNVTGTTTTVNTTNLDVTDKNITIAKGNTSDATADGAGITIDSGTDITWNFVDANDAWVSSIGVEATTFVKAPYGHFTGSTTAATGSGVEVFAPDANTGQIQSYNRGTTTFNELRVKGASVGIYTGTTNAIVGTFNSTGFTMESGKNINTENSIINAGGITIAANSDIRMPNGSWTGDYGAKIQHHDNYLFLQGGSNGVNLRNAAGNRQLNMSNDGHFGPGNAQAYNLGSSAFPWTNLFIDGNIAINESSPDNKLHITTTSSTAYETNTSNTQNLTNALLKLENLDGTDNTGVNNYVGIQFSVANGATSSSQLNYVRTGNNSGRFAFKARNGGGSDYPNLMDITSAGQVLIGASSSTSSAKLAVNGCTNGAEAFFELNRTDDPNADQNIGVIEFSQGNSASRNAARIMTRRDGGVWGAASLPTRFEFHTCISGSNSAVERLRIASNGNIIVKTDDVALSGSGTLRINSGSTTGTLNLDGGATNHGGEINLLGGSNGGRILFRTGQGSGQQPEKMRLSENGHIFLRSASVNYLVMGSSGDATSSGPTNNMNWVRGNATNMQYNNAGGFHGWEVQGSEKMVLGNDGNLELRSAAQNRITFGSAGTSGNDTNWIRGDGDDLMFNCRTGGDFKWEMDGGLVAELTTAKKVQGILVGKREFSLSMSDNSSWNYCFTVHGNSLCSQVEVRINGTRDSTVFNGAFEIFGTHASPQYVIRSIGPTYSAVWIKLVGNNYGSYNAYFKRGGTSGACTANVRVYPRMNEYVDQNEDSGYSSTAMEAQAYSGMQLRSSTPNDADLTIDGNLSKGSGSFKIPHPLTSLKDTKNLVHSFIEGPSCDLIYRGTATLSSGSATVNIDTVSGMTAGTFAALNKNAQCFTTNESGWGAVKGSVSGSTLTITAQDGSSTDNVSWMVVGQRKDDVIKNSSITDANGDLVLEPSIDPTEDSPTDSYPSNPSQYDSL